MKNDKGWSEQEDLFAIEKWNRNWSASQIAKHLINRSPNSVIGRVHRLRQKHPDLEIRIAVRKPRPKRVPAPAGQIAEIPLEPKSPTVKADRFKGKKPEELTAPPAFHSGPAKKLGLIDLEDHHCKFPIGDPKQPDFYFCGAQKIPGCPYCADHARIAFRPGTSLFDAARARRRQMREAA